MEKIERVGLAKLNVIGNELMRIEVELDILNEKLVFIGKYREKIQTFQNWQTFVIEEHSVSDDQANFEEIIKSVYDTMQKRVEMFNLAKTFLHEVTEVEIKKD
jgi:hypothetical protein